MVHNEEEEEKDTWYYPCVNTCISPTTHHLLHPNGNMCVIRATPTRPPTYTSLPHHHHHTSAEPTASSCSSIAAPLFVVAASVLKNCCNAFNTDPCNKGLCTNCMEAGSVVAVTEVATVGCC